MIIYILATFIVSAVCGFVFTPLILDFCQRKNLYDIPNGRKVHKNATPRMGGVSFFPSMLTASLLVLLFYPGIEGRNLTLNIWTVSFLMGLIIIYALGIIDDLVGLNALTKFTVQILGGCLFPLCGLYINNLYGLFGIYEISSFVGIPLTVFMIVFVSNAINLIDGIDGLSSGLCILILLAYTFVFRETPAIAALDAAIVGSLLVFWFFNVFGKVGGLKIFMGDAGSLFLGYVCAYMSIKSLMRPIAPVDCGEEQMLISITLLLIPVLDVIRVTLQRRITGHGIFEPDKTHIHHILMNAGLSMHATLACILILFFLICGINYALWQCNFLMPLIVLTDVAIYALVCGVLLLMGKSDN